MLAGLIRDDERTSLQGVPGLSDIPVVGRLFAHNQKTTEQTDIVLTLTPHIIRVLDLTEADLRPFRVGSDAAASVIDLPIQTPQLPPAPLDPAQQPASPNPAPAQPPGAPIAPVVPPLPPVPG